MTYTPYVWHDLEGGGTLVTAARLNAIEQGLGAASTPSDGAVYVKSYTELQAALTAATTTDAITRITVVAGSTITLTNSNRITIDAAWAYVDFQGCYVDATALTTGAGAAVTVTGTVNPPYQQSTKGFDNLYLVGPGKTVTGVTGILFIGAATSTDLSGPSHLQPQHVNLSSFETGVSYGNHTYVIDLLNWDIYRCGTGVKIPAGLTDAGERYGYTACTIFNNTTNVDVQLNGTDVFFQGGSLDYPSDAHIKNAGGQIHLDGTHLESGTKSTPDLVNSGNGGVIALRGGTFSNTGTPTWAAPILNNANNGGQVLLDGTHLTGLTSTTGYLATGTGITKARDTTGYDIATTCEMVADTADLIADGGFEQSSIVDRWYIAADTATVGSGNQYTGTNVAMTVSTTAKHSGAQSLKITKNGGAGTAALVSLAIPIPTGQRPRLRLYYGKPGSQTGTVFITARYGNAYNNPANGLPKTGASATLKETTLTLTSAAIPFTKWTLGDPTVRTPMWATHLIIDINLVSMAAGDFYIDDVEASTL